MNGEPGRGSGPGAGPVRRVTVMHPHTAAPRSRGAGPHRRDLDEQTVVGEVLIRSLIRAQLGLALRVCTVLALLLGGLPLLFALVPSLSRYRVLGLDLPWLLLGVLAYPGLVAAGWVYIRRASRNERDFLELMGRR